MFLHGNGSDAGTNEELPRDLLLHVQNVLHGDVEFFLNGQRVDGDVLEDVVLLMFLFRIQRE